MDKLSRREALRTGAVVAGAAWTAPLVRTASAADLLASGSPGPGGCTKPTSLVTNFNATNPCGTTNCVRPQSYWKTHSSYGPDPRNAAWNAAPENSLFFLSPKTNYQVIQLGPPQTNPYYTLAPAYLAAKLNVAAGAQMPAVIQAAYNEATGYFGRYTPNEVLLVQYAALRTRFVFLAQLLTAYINGQQGVPACSGSDPCATAAIWFNAIVSSTVIGSPSGIVEVLLKNQQVNYTRMMVNYTVTIPNTLMRYNPSITVASLTWDNTFTRWIVNIPMSQAANYNFGGGVMFPIPVAAFPAGVTNVTWTGQAQIPPEISNVCWKWGAAVYQSYTPSPANYGVVPTNGIFPAGTPAYLLTQLKPGATGNGGNNYTGTRTTQQCVNCTS